jgi:hypothetical protein
MLRRPLRRLLELVEKLLAELRMGATFVGTESG